MINKLLTLLGIRKPKIKRYLIRLDYGGRLQIQGVAWGFCDDNINWLTDSLEHVRPFVFIDEVVETAGPVKLLMEGELK